jgi:hypothetical protein
MYSTMFVKQTVNKCPRIRLGFAAFTKNALLPYRQQGIFYTNLA